MPAARRQPAVGGRITLRRAALLLLSGLILAAPGASPAGAQQASAERPSRSDPYGAFITEAAQRFGVPEAWIRAVMRVESAGDVRAISSAGAMGLMQIMPATWAELRVRHRLGSNPYDPRDNILAGTGPLRRVSRRSPIAGRDARLCHDARPNCRRRRTRRPSRGGGCRSARLDAGAALRRAVGRQRTCRANAVRRRAR